MAPAMGPSSSLVWGQLLESVAAALVTGLLTLAGVLVSTIALALIGVGYLWGLKLTDITI